ncbi:hypothetical protein DPMN_030044 [Dreissena polymorpha]|uniref:Uncharacterized protein n=1 Tax=Dreissena polymorpha TaxID=45954 RepID=A0A9D4M1X1_DREPO|nr:hypothetical protein DPMN_030044 [Dreissena polymorpha]
MATRRLKNTHFSVHEDFTERVKSHRRELGKRLVDERARGNNAVMNYDKLIVNNKIFAYDENNQTIIEIGTARGRPRPISSKGTMRHGRRGTGEGRARVSNTQVLAEDSADSETSADEIVD